MAKNFRLDVTKAMAGSSTFMRSGSATTYQSASFLEAESGSIVNLYSPLLMPAATGTVFPTPNEGTGSIYVSAEDYKLYYQDSYGNEYDLTIGSTPGGVMTGSNLLIDGSPTGSINFVNDGYIRNVATISGSSTVEPSLALSGSHITASCESFTLFNPNSLERSRLNFISDQGDDAEDRASITVGPAGGITLEAAANVYNTVFVNAGAQTTGDGLTVVADALTTGTGLIVNSKSSDTGTGASKLVFINSDGDRGSDSNAHIGLDINFDSTAGIAARALKIDSEQTTGTVFEIDATEITTGYGQVIQCAGLTSGDGLYIDPGAALSSGIGLHVKSATTVDDAGHMALFYQSGDRAGTAASTVLSLIQGTTANVNARTLYINSAQTTGIVVDIDATDITTGVGLSVTTNDRTTGAGLYVRDTGTSDSAGPLAFITQAGDRAGTAVSTGLEIDFNTTANVNAVAFKVDSEQTTGTVAFIVANQITEGFGLSINMGSTRTTGTGLFIKDTGTSDSAGVLASIAQAGDRAGSAASIGLNIDFATTANANARAFKIDSEQTTGTVFELDADQVTEGTALDITADALTSGKMLNLVSNSSDATDRNLLLVHNDHTSATGCVPFQVINDATNTYVLRADSGNTETTYGSIVGLRRRDTSAVADGMGVGLINFEGYNNAGTPEAYAYARISGFASDISDGNEGGIFKIAVHAGGIDGTAELVELLNIGGEVQSSATYPSIVVNETGINCDFRVESADESHMIFVEGSTNRVSIGDNTGSPGATLEVKNNASAGAYGVPLVQLNSNDTDEVALDINASNIDANVIDILANALTTGNALSIATSAKVPVLIDLDYTDTAETLTAPIKCLEIDFDKTGASTAGNAIYGLFVDMDNTEATDGYNLMYGVYTQPTLTHDEDAGLASVYGIKTVATGGTNGTGTATGGWFEATGAGNNRGVIIRTDDGGDDFYIASSADFGDFFKIQVGAAGVTTFTTVDDGGAAADLTFTVDGKIVINAAAATGVVFNETGVDVDFRVESENLQDIISVDAGKDMVDIVKMGSDPGTMEYGYRFWKDIGSADPFGFTADDSACFGEFLTLPAGSVTYGNFYYLTDSAAVALTDASAAATAGPVMLLYNPTNDAGKGLLYRGFVRLSSTALPSPATAKIGDPVYLSTTAGKLTFTAPSASGEIVRVVGYCVQTANSAASSIIYFNPDNTWIEIA